MVHVEVKKNREKSLQNRHPWLFSGSIYREKGEGPYARVDTFDKKISAWGVYNPRSQIRVRILDFTPLPSHPERVIMERLRDAASFRRHFLPASTNAFRLVNSEGDGVPGVIVDVYGDLMVVSTTCGGWESIREEVLFSALKKAWNVKAVYLKNNLEVRKTEGLSIRDDWLSAYTVPMPVRVEENGLFYLVDAVEGQKTGFFLDQRENRRFLSSLTHGLNVLNVFSYTGAFSVSALHGGARHVTNVDTSLPALDLSKENHRQNGFSESMYTQIREDAFEYLRYLQKKGSKFDLVILDPPALCKSSTHVKRATRGYKDLNLQALRLLRPGGCLFTFSCSGHVSPTLFRQIVFGAALDARVSARILRQAGADWDHPVNVYCPEGEYLKGLLLRVN